MLRYDVTRGWREVLADGKEIPVVSVRRPSVSQVQLLDESLAAMEKSGVFTPEELATARRIRDKWWTSTEPFVETPLKTGDVVWVATSVPFGVIGHVSDVNSTNLGKVQIPGGFTVENVVDLAVAGVSIVTGAHMMYVAPGTVIDTAWPEFKFLGGRRRHVVKVRKIRGVESVGFFVPVPRSWGVTAGGNAWGSLETARQMQHGVLASPMQPLQPKLPRVRKRDFRLRFNRWNDGMVRVATQKQTRLGWVEVGSYSYKVPK